MLYNALELKSIVKNSKWFMGYNLRAKSKEKKEMK